MSATIIRSTEGRGLAGLALRLRAGSHPVGIGVLGDAKEADGTPLTTVAMANEFGTATIPERSFLRAGIRRAMSELRALNRRNLASVARGSMTETAALNSLGMRGASAVRRYIRTATFTPNAPSTIARKGSDKPLRDTDTLVQNITHEILGRAGRGLK